MAIRMTGLVSNMDTESIIQSLMSVQKLKQTKIENKITKLEWKQETWKSMNTKLYSFYSDTLSKFRLQSSFATKKGTSSDESVATVTASSSAAEGTHSLKVNQLASSQFVTGGELSTDDNSLAVSTSTKLIDLGMTAGSTITAKVGDDTTGSTLEVTESTTITDFLSKLKDAGLSASYDTTQKRFFISSKQSGTDNSFTLDTNDSSKLGKLGLGTITNNGGTMEYTTSVDATSQMSLTQPKDAKYNYNGVDFTSSSNNISINGLSITLKGLTEGADTTGNASDDVPISFSVSNDTQAVYDMVKSFVTSYNSLLKEMNTYYHADSASGYDPLTDDEKESMSDDEIDKWETKIKDSLLRRDGTLSTLITSMRSNLNGNVPVNGKSYSLSSYGIGTSSDYTEKGLLHIDGNADDSTTSYKTDKLLAALNEDPDTVAKVLTTLAGNLYKQLGENMSGTSLRSALTFYNDKEMKNTLTDYNEELDEMEDRLQDMEDRYYAQFSAMETALAKMNSQSSSLASMLGTSS